MMALEEEFDITLDEEGAERIATVEEAAVEIMKKMKADKWTSLNISFWEIIYFTS